MNRLVSSMKLTFFSAFFSTTTSSINCWCLIFLLFGSSSIVFCQDTSAQSSNSNTNKLQQVSTVTQEPETPFKLTSWDAFKSAIDMVARSVNDPNACKPDIMEKTHSCYNDYSERWDHGGTEKKFCCFAQDVLDCFYKMVPVYCDKTGNDIYLSPEEQQMIYFSASKDVCGSYHSFWHCDNGIPIVVGASCGALVIIILVVVGVIFFLRKRKGSSSLSRDGNL